MILKLFILFNPIIDNPITTGEKKLYSFWPIVDSTSPEPFLPAHPITILHNKQQKMVPFMTGVNKDEG